MRLIVLFILCIPLCFTVNARALHVGSGKAYTSVKQGLSAAVSGDSIIIYAGTYKEGNIQIDRPVSIIGVGFPVIDGDKKTEILSVRSSDVVINGLKLIRSGYAMLEDPCAVKVYNCQRVQVINNILDDNYFGIYLQYSKYCTVKNNKIQAYGKAEQGIGNGIHCFRSDTLQITGNTIQGHRDGIYFEFVSGSVIWNNTSTRNIRYGLHFMFSNSDIYVNNIFRNNGAGVAVMFSRQVSMYNNMFIKNWGDAAYGLMLKEISDGYISGNKFSDNTSGIYMEGASRMIVEKNTFDANGWGMKIQASCLDNFINKNNFTSNTFDVSTNGSLVQNKFENNYWDKYEGYDLNKDGVGDVQYHPLSLFSVIVEKNPPAMILFRSFMVNLLDKSEKLIPSLTPDNFTDENPLMKPLQL